MDVYTVLYRPVIHTMKDEEMKHEEQPTQRMNNESTTMNQPTKQASSQPSKQLTREIGESVKGKGKGAGRTSNT